jgi:hypothetical protein
MRLAAAAALLAMAGALSGCIQVEVGAQPAAAPEPDDGVASLVLRVLDAATEAPLAAADVRLSLDAGAVTKKTGDDGSVTFNVRPAASCSATVSRPGYAGRIVDLDCSADRAYRVLLTRSPGPAGTQSPPPPGPSPSPSPSPSGEPGGNGTGNGTAGGNGTSPPPRPFEPAEPEGSCGTLGSFQPILPNPLLIPGLATGWPLLRLDVAVIADPSFVRAHPADWRGLLRDLVLDANQVYEPQVGIRLNVSLVDRLPDGSLQPGSGDGQQRAVARGYMKANHPDSRHDLVAVILGADYEGSVAGQVECVHGAAYPDYAYLWSEYDGPRDGLSFLGAVGMFQDVPLKVFMHEAAHLLAAHHHYSDCAESYLDARVDDALGACDIMINDIGLASFRFGPANRLVMRSFVEATGIGEPV